MDYLLPGKVTKIIDPHNFWMQIGTDENLSDFTQFEADINDYCSQIKSPLDDVSRLEEGQIVLVDCTCSSNCCWRRGQVARIDRETNSVDILYIDYGETELVHVGRLCADFPPDFLCLPYQALHCSLTGISPIAKSWTTRGIKTFKDLTENKMFQTIVIGIQPDMYTVALYTRDEEEGVSVTHILLDEEIGIPSEETLPPKMVSDVIPFYSESLAEQKENDEIDANYESNEHQNEHSSNTEDSPSHEVALSIPTFDIRQIEKTKAVSSNVLLSKQQKQQLDLQKEEAEKLSQQVEAEAAMAALAGYGGKEDMIRSPEALHSPNVTEHIFADIRKFRGPDHFEPKMDENILSHSYAIDGSTCKRGPIRQSWQNDEPLIHDNNQDITTASHEDVNFMQHFNRILREFEKNNLFNWRLQMSELISTAYSITPEELLDAVNTLLRKAIRRYEVDHDIHLEILGMLSGLNKFNECLLSAVGKLQSTYVKVNNVGTPYHVQYSKIIGYLYILCPSWTNCQSVCDFILSSCEKWVVFNKRGTQLGQDKLQEVFLETFGGFWDMAHDAVEEVRPDFVTNIKQEIRDKLLNDGVVRCIRERLLNLLLQFFTSKCKETVKTRHDVGCGIGSVSQRSVACQTRKHTKYSPDKEGAESKSKSDSRVWPVLNESLNESMFPRIGDTNYKPDPSKSQTPGQSKSWSSVVKDDTPKSSQNVADSNNPRGQKFNDGKDNRGDNSNTAGLDNPYGLWSSIFKCKSPDEISENKDLGGKDKAVEGESAERLLGNREKLSIKTEQEEKITGSPRPKQSSMYYNKMKKIKSPVDRQSTGRPVFYRMSPSEYDKLSASKNLYTLANDFLTGSGVTKTDASDTDNSEMQIKSNSSQNTDRQKDVLETETVKNRTKFDSSCNTDNQKDLIALNASSECLKNNAVSLENSKTTETSEEFDWFSMSKADKFEDNVPKTSAEDKNGATPEMNSVLSATAYVIPDSDDSDDDSDATWTSDMEDYIPLVVGYENEKLEKTDDSSSEKSEYSSSENSERQTSSRSLWIPGKRKCTLCGDENHLIYDCPNKNQRSFLL